MNNMAIKIDFLGSNCVGFIYFFWQIVNTFNWRQQFSEEDVPVNKIYVCENPMRTYMDVIVIKKNLKTTGPTVIKISVIYWSSRYLNNFRSS